MERDWSSIHITRRAGGLSLSSCQKFTEEGWVAVTVFAFYSVCGCVSPCLFCFRIQNSISSTPVSDS